MMTRQTKLQIWAGIGTLLSVPLLYIGLVQDSEVLATAGFAAFAISLLITPMMKILSI